MNRAQISAKRESAAIPPGDFSRETPAPHTPPSLTASPKILRQALEQRLSAQAAELEKARTTIQAQLSEIAFLKSSLASVRRQESLRLAQELHDDLSQQLAGIILFTGAIARKMPPEEHGTRSKLDELVGLLDGTILTCKNLVHRKHL